MNEYYKDADVAKYSPILSMDVPEKEESPPIPTGKVL